MADIQELNFKGDASAVSTWSAGAASFTIACGNGADSRAALLVNNLNTDITTRVVVSAGDEYRSGLGALTFDIAASSLGIVPLNDSARFKVETTNKITVALNSTADTALTATPLASLKTLLIQG